MKVLAIRGSNIASLAGSFEVDFERPPLSGAGLFAITGPTGAGKSTLLDVLCLALFAKTPRVSEAGALRVPGAGGNAESQAITAQDPRNLLRRGAAEGYAEAEFVASDGLRYRAHWEVRRARGKASGSFQKASWVLWRTDGGVEAPVAGGATEVEAQVSAALGLSFEQFRKAVLLAQGDFAAFLRAKEKERAELLEKITGADIYTAVSKKAWERGQAVSGRLEVLDARLTELVPLDGEERLRQEQEAAARRLEIGALDERRHRLEDAKRRAGEAATREREAREAAGRVETERRVLGEKAEAVERGEKERLDALVKLDAARLQREQSNPDVERARDLDAQLAAKGEAARRAQAEVFTAHEELESVRERASGLDQDLRVVRATMEASRVWLGGHAGDEPLVRQWPACERALGQLARRHEEIGAERRRAQDAGRVADEAGARVASAEGRRVLAAARLDAAGANVEASVEAAKEVDRGELVAEAARISAEIEALAALRQIAGTVAGAVVRGEEAATAGRIAREEAERSDRLAWEAERNADEAQARVVLLTGQRDAALAVRDLAQRRAALGEGEPCPLCGSREHPWAGSGEARADGTRVLAGELAAAAEQARKATSDGVRQRAEAANARKRVEEADAVAGKAAAEIARLEREWQERASALRDDGPSRSEPPAPTERNATVERLAASLEAARKRLAEVSRRDVLAGELERRLAHARREREENVKAADLAIAEVREAEKGLAEARLALSGAKAKLESLEREERVLVADLDRFVGDDSEGARLLPTDPALLASRWTARVEDFHSQEKARDAAAARIGILETAAAAENAHRERAAAALAGKNAVASELSMTLAALTGMRGELLAGRSVREVTEALEAAVKGAEQNLERASARHAEAVAVRERAVAAATAADEDQARATVRWEAARTERDAAFVVLELPADAEGADRAIGAAAAGIAKRRGEAEDFLRGFDAALLADDRTLTDRQRLGEERSRIERDGQVWLSLRSLIGEASGGKFRRFAQGLTLEALVRSANGHLAEFARRYRLVQAPGTEVGLLVVDCDMGDEIRSVESLSGGESFLVSLALALGLASLATRRNSIGSLFIDEGFGSLDADTLDRAVTALDALQANGRRIGVISHVHGLAEKIGVQVKVVARGGGRSEVRVVGA